MWAGKALRRPDPPHAIASRNRGAERRTRSIDGDEWCVNCLFSIGGLSLLLGSMLVVYMLSSLPDPWRPALAGVIALTWLGAAISLTFYLGRDLTPAEIRDEGLRVGKRLIRYEDILSISEHRSRAIFTLELREPRKELDISKVGITSEDEFFRALRVKVSTPDVSE